MDKVNFTLPQLERIVTDVERTSAAFPASAMATIERIKPRLKEFNDSKGIWADDLLYRCRKVANRVAAM